MGKNHVAGADDAKEHLESESPTMLASAWDEYCLGCV